MCSLYTERVCGVYEKGSARISADEDDHVQLLLECNGEVKVTLEAVDSVALHRSDSFVHTIYTD